MNQKTTYWIGAGTVALAIILCAVWPCPAGADTTCFTGMIKHHPATFAIGLLACMGVVAGLLQLRGYGAALIATAPFLPGTAALMTVLIFLTPCWTVCCGGRYAPFWGTGIALLLWVVAALFCLRFTCAQHAIPSSYGELCQRLAQLTSQRDVVCPEHGHPDDQGKNTACSQAKTQVDGMVEEFKLQGLSWVLARGYINAWTRLHRAEEAMIEVAPQETVIAGALNDVLRLQGSKIDHADDLVARLRHAIDVIDPSAAKYVGAATTPLPLVITTPSPLAGGCLAKEYKQKLDASGGTPPVHWSLSQSTPPDGLELSPVGVLSGTPTTSGAATFTVRVTDSANVTATKAFTLTIAAAGAATGARTGDAQATKGTDVPCGDSAQARAVLRSVRCAINEFRDGCWNGLIVARNRLLATMMLTVTTAYVLLAIAIMCGAQRPAVCAASAFYLVGATIGLLNQLRSVSQSDTAVEDYGLSAARLVTTPLFCGLAAIGGVVLMAMPQMASSYSAISTPLAITTPSKLDTGIFEKLYHQKIDATGGTPPYSWSASSGPLPEGMGLKATGDLIAKLPKKTEAPKTVKFTAQVKDSTGSAVEKSFFLNITSAGKASAENQPATKVSTSPPTAIIRPLADMFDLHKNLIGLLVAAIFGLTPGLLFDRLQQQTDKYKADLKSSEATNVKQQPQKT